MPLVDEAEPVTASIVVCSLQQLLSNFCCYLNLTLRIFVSVMTIVLRDHRKACQVFACSNLLCHNAQQADFSSQPAVSKLPVHLCSGFRKMILQSNHPAGASLQSPISQGTCYRFTDDAFIVDLLTATLVWVVKASCGCPYKATCVQWSQCNALQQYVIKVLSVFNWLDILIYGRGGTVTQQVWSLDFARRAFHELTRQCNKRLILSLFAYTVGLPKLMPHIDAGMAVEWRIEICCDAVTAALQWSALFRSTRLLDISWDWTFETLHVLKNILIKLPS